MLSTPPALPHSEEAERAVLASVLLKPSLVTKLAEMVSAEMFYLERHGVIYGAMLRVHAAGQEVDLRTLQHDLEERKQWEQVGGAAYLAGMDLDVPDLGRFDTYCGLVRERWARRSLVLSVTEAAQKALDSGEETSDLLAGVQDEMLRIDRERAVGGRFRRLGDVLLDCDVFTERSDGLLGHPSGFADLDRVTLGAQEGQLWVIAGRPSMGKTSLAVQMARHQAEQGLKVAFVSLEDISQRLAVKVLSQVSDVPHQRLHLGRTTSKERPVLVEHMRSLDRLELYLDDTPGQTVQQIASGARMLAQRSGLDVLYLDYLSLLRAAGKQESRNLEIGLIAESLKNLAKSLSIPVHLLSQLSRRVEQRADKRPMLSDLRDSGEIEQHADTVLMCYRQSWYEPDNEEVAGLAEIIVAKNKGGETGTVRLVFLGEITAFRDLSRHEELDYARSQAW